MRHKYRQLGRLFQHQILVNANGSVLEWDEDIRFHTVGDLKMWDVNLRAPRLARNGSGEEMVRDGKHLLPAYYADATTRELIRKVRPGTQSVGTHRIAAAVMIIVPIVFGDAQQSVGVGGLLLFFFLCGQNHLAGGVGLLHGALRVNAGGRVGLLAANRADGT